MLDVQQRRERVQMEEEAINTAIIQETEEELQQINKSLYKVLWRRGPESIPFAVDVLLESCRQRFLSSKCGRVRENVRATDALRRRSSLVSQNAAFRCLSDANIVTPGR